MTLAHKTQNTALGSGWKTGKLATSRCIIWMHYVFHTFDLFFCIYLLMRTCMLQRLRDIVSEHVASCEYGYWNFFRQRLLYNRRVPSNSSGIATHTKSPPPRHYNIREHYIADQNKRSRSGLLFDHGISGQRKFVKKTFRNFGGTVLPRKKTKNFVGIVNSWRKPAIFGGITPALASIKITPIRKLLFEITRHYSVHCYDDVTRLNEWTSTAPRNSPRVPLNLIYHPFVYDRNKLH